MRSSGPSLEIILDRPELLVRGSFDEATPAVLSGRLVVHLHESIRVRSLKMVFSGRVDTFVNQNQLGAISAKDEHREFITHEWQFLESQKHALAWGPEDKVFPFDLVVPGDNPETVMAALSKVRYQLHAVLERTSFHVNLVASTDVLVKRGPMPGAPWALALMESIEAAGDWAQQLEYRVSVPTRSLKDGELFHTRFELEPRIKGLKLVSVGVLIKEYVRYYSSTGDSLHRFARVAARNENFINQAGVCSTAPRKATECLDLVDATSVQIPLAVPEAYTGIQYDVLSDLIEIRHRIKFLIKVRDSSMLIHSIFIAVPVSIMPVTARDDSNLLPRYEAALSNPGMVIMRSSTLPPAYDAILPPSLLRPGIASDDCPLAQLPTGNNSAAQSSMQQCAGAETGCAVVEVGTEVNGFPGPLRRSRSQFYLASPDSTPPMRPLDAAAFADHSASGDGGACSGSGSNSRMANSPNHRASLAAVLASNSGDLHPLDDDRSGLPLPLPPFLFEQQQPHHGSNNWHSNAHGNASESQLDSCHHSLYRPESRTSTTSSSRRLSSLGERIVNSKISDKVRAIFHTRSSSSGFSHLRRYSNASSAEVNHQSTVRSMTPPLPPPGRIHPHYETCSATMPQPRRSSVAAAVLPALPGTAASRYSVPSSHRTANSISMLNGFGLLSPEGSGRSVADLDGAIKPPPGALLHHSNQSVSPSSPLAANGAMSASPVAFH